MKLINPMEEENYDTDRFYNNDSSIVKLLLSK